MRTSLLTLATLSLAACAAEQGLPAATPSKSNSCLEQYLKSGVIKGTMEKVVAADGTITFIFTEKVPCDTPSGASLSPTTNEDASMEEKPK